MYKANTIWYIYCFFQRVTARYCALLHALLHTLLLKLKRNTIWYI